MVAGGGRWGPPYKIGLSSFLYMRIPNFYISSFNHHYFICAHIVLISILGYCCGLLIQWTFDLTGGGPDQTPLHYFAVIFILLADRCESFDVSYVFRSKRPTKTFLATNSQCSRPGYPIFGARKVIPYGKGVRSDFPKNGKWSLSGTKYNLVPILKVVDQEIILLVLKIINISLAG